MNGCPFQQVLRQNLGWFLSQHWKTLFPRGFILRPAERAQILLKMILGIFKIDRYVFMFLIQQFNLRQIFWKAKAFFKKLEYSFLVESTKIENASFLQKTAISEANVKTNKMVSIKWTYHKERSFVSNYFLFLKNLFQFKNLLKRVDFLY